MAREFVEEYKGVDIEHEGGRYFVRLFAPDGSRVYSPPLASVASARRQIGAALKRGATAKAPNQIAALAKDAADLVRARRSGGGRGHNVTSNPRKRARRNPPRYGVTGDSKGKRVVAVLGTPLDIRYIHAADKKAYKHEFSKSARIVVYADGTVGIVGQRGQAMWGDF